MGGGYGAGTVGAAGLGGLLGGMFLGEQMAGGGFGGGGGYGGHKGGQKGGGGGGYGRVEDFEDVDDRDIGKIIGKGGCNIKDLQAGTGCRIITPDRNESGSDPSMRQVKIQGPTKEAVARCKKAISGVLMGDEPRDALAEIDGAVIMKNVDPMSMGHLAKIKDKLEGDLKITLNLDARSVRIWAKDGDRQSALDAKEAIEEELEDITSVDTLTVQVPGDVVNQVINDSALRQLQDQTGLTANVCKNDKGTGIRLTGLAGAIQEAKLLIERRAQGEGAEFLSLMPGLFSKMSHKMWDDFQRDLGFMQQSTGAQVNILDGSNRVDFAGGPDEVRRAKSELQDVLKFYFPQECEVIHLPPESVDWIAGEDDRELMRLQSAGAVVSLDRSMATMWCCGNPRSVEQVRNRIRNSLNRWERERVCITLQSKSQALAVIGSGGSTIRELQSSTQTRIAVDTDNLTIVIAGREESVRDAKARVMALIGGAGGGKGGGGGGGFACFNCGEEGHRASECPNPPSGGGKGGKSGAPSGKLYIANLPDDITEEAIQFVFKTYGQVKRVHIMNGKVVNGCVSAFVDYDSINEAETAIATLNEKYEIRPGFGPIAVRHANAPRSKPY